MAALTPQDHTFVVCAYGENPFLEQAIESVEHQRSLGSILVMTSTPNDHIRGICERHGLDFLVNEGESSIARDWNFGYDHAETDLVTIVHQDDFYEPTYLEKVLGALNRFPYEAGLVHTGYYELREEARVYNNRLLKIKRVLNASFARSMASSSVSAKRRSLAFGDFICCPSVTLNKAVIGPSAFDVEYANSCDYRTWVNLANRNVRFIYVSEPLMGHRIYPESTTTANIESNVRSLEDREVLASLWPKPIARVMSLIYAMSQKSNKL